MGRGIAYNVGRIACEYADGFRANCAFLGETAVSGFAMLRYIMSLRKMDMILLKMNWNFFPGNVKICFL